MEGVVLSLARLAGVVNSQQQPERATRLLGAATALIYATPVTLDTSDRHDYDRIVANVQAQQDEVACATAWAEGRAMPLAQAIVYALELPH
jgi:hypothetical protein